MANMSTEDDCRLRNAVVPRHYDLRYTLIDLDRHKFEGDVSIELAALHDGEDSSFNSVEIHLLDLQLLSAKLYVQGTQSIPAVEAEEFRYRKKNQTCEIIFPSDGNKSIWVEGASYLLTIHFSGILNNQMRGLYRSTFVGLDGKSHTMATTQFEPTDARRAFPCMDEPALKATFCLSVKISTNLQCISNTPIASSHTTYEGGTGLKTITYERTPKMSTYLVALVVSDFDSISRVSNGIQTTIYTAPGKAHQAHFCLDVAVQALDLYQEIFDIPYPLVKSDLLAIPDFAAGAMENWGCVTYREAKVLVKEGSTSETMKRGIARTVCHELAHMWFGNLVTMDFWTQLWLKEGVARFMEFVGIDTIFPEWDAWTEFVQSVYGLALSLDSMKSSHPIEVVVKHPDEINEIFDAISYAKGASVIRMVSSYLGFDTFMNGMKIYLKKYAYGNATTEMLWQALEEASGVPVVKLMTPWTAQVGFPVLFIPSEEGGSILTPRFCASGIECQNEETIWPIPVTAIVEGHNEVQGPWVINGPLGDDSNLLLTKINDWTACGKWFKLNAAQTGFYRVGYTKTQWEKLAKIMWPGGPLSAADRLGLISDSFAAGKAGYAPIINSLAFVQNFGSHEEAEYAVWQELSENLANLASLYRSEAFFDKYKNFLLLIYSKQMQKIGWDAIPGESQRTGTLRGTIINMMSIAGDYDVGKEAFERFMAFAEKTNNDGIPGDLQKIVFRAALRHNEDEVYPTLRRIYELSDFPETQRNCLSVMACVRDTSKHAEMLEYVLFSEKVRLQDIAFPLNSLSNASDVGGKACWQLLKSKFDVLRSKFGRGPMWGPCVGLLCRGLNSLEEADEVEDFFSQSGREPGSAKRRLSQALEAVRTRAVRMDRDREAVGEFLSTL